MAPTRLRNRSARLAAALALAITASLASAAPAPARAPERASVAPGFVKHAGPNWVWFGPPDWVASYGVYGITASSANGRTVLDLGFSSIACAAGQDWNQSVANYFAGQRAALTGNGVTITAASQIVHPVGMSATYRRQVLKIATGGVRAVKGKVVLDYDFTTTVDGFNYCYQRSIGLTAPTRRWRADKHTLARVQDSLAYSGPGTYEDDPDD